MSCVAPVLLVLLLEALFDSVPGFARIGLDISKYALPTAAFFIFFLTYIICTIVLVRERREGTLSRMFSAGYRRWSVVLGYTLGYGMLAAVQTVLVIAATVWAFDIDMAGRTLPVALTTLTLSIVSLALGIFISTLARSEGQVIPTIPLIIIPSLLLSGLIIPLDDLHAVLRGIAYVLPLTYAEEVLLGVMRDGKGFGEVLKPFLILLGYGIALLGIASLTVREAD